MNELYLGFEGGGSKTRAILADDSGSILFRDVTGPASALYVTASQFRHQVEGMLRPMKRIAEGRHASVVAAALAGPMDKEIAARAIYDLFGRIHLHDLSEGEVALSCHDLRSGLAVVAGTGSSAWALTSDLSLHSSGGFGPQFGDEGSAYWIGKEALAAAARAEDGRGPATELQKRLFDHFGVRSVRDLYKFCDSNGHLFAPTVASLGKLVIESAHDRDSVARGILRTAGRALAQMVLVMRERAEFEEASVPVVPAGGVFRAGDHVLKPFEQILGRSPYDFTIYPAVIEPAEGLIHYLLLRYEKSGLFARN
jgi:N-acetylglucosamine kinase-like BadF-type ATPase